MVPKLPKVAGLGGCPASRRNIRRRFLLVEIILYGLGGVKLVHQSVDFLGIEAGKGNVKSGSVQLGDDLGQLRLVPIALNPVQGKVQSLFFSGSKSTTTQSISVSPISSSTFSRWWPPTTKPVAPFQTTGSTIQTPQWSVSVFHSPCRRASNPGAGCMPPGSAGWHSLSVSAFSSPSSGW